MESYAVIMAGASRNGLWPLGREACPKPFMVDLGGSRTFLQATYDRLCQVFPRERILVVTLERYRDLALEQIPGLPEETLRLEPYGRGTAPCIAFAAYTLLCRCPDAGMLITPADRTVADENLFAETARRALDYVLGHDALVSLGVVPTRPDTHFGYIQVKDPVEGNEDRPLKVKTFTEKPDEALARVFIESREFFWNSGMLLCRAAVIRRELERFAPEGTRLFAGWKEALDSPGRRDFLQSAYAAVPNISVDYAVMEKTDCAWLLPARFGWSDLNSWDLVAENLPRDKSGNTVRAGKTLLQDSRDTLVVSSVPGKLVCVKGLRGYVVVDTGDALMICPKDDAAVGSLTSDLAMPGFEKYR